MSREHGRPAGGGTLTPEIIRRSLDYLWSQQREQRNPARFTGLRSMLALKSPLACGDTLFAPIPGMSDMLKAELIATGTPVHPLHAAWLNSPVQGPAPLECAREPHPDSPWHWDGQGTWWCS